MATQNLRVSSKLSSFSIWWLISSTVSIGISQCDQFIDSMSFVGFLSTLAYPNTWYSWTVFRNRNYSILFLNEIENVKLVEWRKKSWIVFVSVIGAWFAVIFLRYLELKSKNLQYGKYYYNVRH